MTTYLSGPVYSTSSSGPRRSSCWSPGAVLLSAGIAYFIYAGKARSDLDELNVAITPAEPVRSPGAGPTQVPRHLGGDGEPTRQQNQPPVSAPATEPERAVTSPLPSAERPPSRRLDHPPGDGARARGAAGDHLGHLRPEHISGGGHHPLVLGEPPGIRASLLRGGHDDSGVPSRRPRLLRPDGDPGAAHGNTHTLHRRGDPDRGAPDTGPWGQPGLRDAQARGGPHTRVQQPRERSAASGCSGTWRAP